MTISGIQVIFFHSESALGLRSAAGLLVGWQVGLLVSTEDSVMGTSPMMLGVLLLLLDEDAI